MKAVVFGASGATGQLLLQQGLARNLEMTAFVRNAKSVQPREHLRAITGDVYNAVEVASAIADQDAVLSALGPRTLAKTDLLEGAMTNILAGMKRHGLKRLIVLGAGGSSQSAEALRHQGVLTRKLYGFLLETILKNPMASQRAQKALMIASDADFTIVQPPRLTNGPATGRYRAEADAFPPNLKAISRADLASFMLSQLDDRKWIRQMPFLCV